MPSFRAPSLTPEPESDLPSTPPRGNIFENNPSTTPAGPPPDIDFSHVSTTPAGPPPRSLYSSVAFTHTSNHHDDLFDSPTRDDHPMPQHDDDEIDFMDVGMDVAAPLTQSTRSLARTQPQDSEFYAAARALPASPASLSESDQLILQTEDVLETLFHQIRNQHTSPRSSHDNISSAVRNLAETWTSATDQHTYTSNIGPDESAPSLVKATFLANLVLDLHHPGPGDSRQGAGGMRVTNNERPTPEILHKWLVNNRPSSAYHSKVLNTTPNATASKSFWDSLLTSAARGELSKVVDLLQAADFGHAVTAKEDIGKLAQGYEGLLLINVNKVIATTIALLNDCPALKEKNWDVTGSRWTLYRYQVERAYEELELLAEGASADRPRLTESAHQDDLSLSAMSRKAQSQIPWKVYEQLQWLYKILLGEAGDIQAASMDWLEATVCTAIWWDGNDDMDLNASQSANQRTKRQSHTARLVDVQAPKAYQLRMAQAFRAFNEELEEGDEGPDPQNAVEMGLACIIEGDVEGLVRIVRHWSITIAVALVEVAGYGGWLGTMQIPSDQVMSGFDDQDLLVLSYARKQDKELKKDEVLAHYASLLSARRELRSGLAESREGWQLAIQVLGRLDNQHVSNTRIAELLNRLNFTTSRPVEQAMGLCHKLGLEQDAYKLSERYADHLLKETTSFGESIVHYARARQSQKLTDTLNMLISYSLVQSSAFPPASSLDPTLHDLISKPDHVITRVRRSDPEAARLLEHHVSGYATVRRFYEIRDQTLAASAPPARKHRQAAAAALVAAVQSAADSIHGGLVAPDVESVLQVDGLLALLCEALVFLGDDSALTRAQAFALLQAVEDLQLAPRDILERCEACVRSAIANAWGSDMPDPKRLMAKKSSSSLSSSSFSLVNSGVLGSEGSGVLVEPEIRRAWDWRRGVDRRAKTEDLVAILRLGLAKAIGRCWLDVDVDAA